MLSVYKKGTTDNFSDNGVRFKLMFHDFLISTDKISRLRANWQDGAIRDTTNEIFTLLVQNFNSQSILRYGLGIGFKLFDLTLLSYFFVRIREVRIE